MKNNITFIIHLRKDTDERVKNAIIILSYYKSLLPQSKFIIIEDDKVQNFKFLEDQNVTYLHMYNEGQHNKCKGYNLGLANSNTSIVCFLDIDCIISRENIQKSIDTITNNDSICIGYNGIAIYFNYYVKSMITDYSESLYDFLESFVDKLNLHTNYTNKFYHVANTKAVGGMLIGHKHTFNKIGGFNPNFKGWGYEDNEIIIRAKKLNTSIFAINTLKPFLLHLPHIDEVNKNKENIHSSYNLNEKEFIKVSNLTKDELENYIMTWK